MAMGRILIVLFSLLSCLAAAERTASQTIVIVQSSTGFATLTGTAASQALATTASGGVAGADTQAQDGLGVAAGGVGSMNDTDAGNSGSDSGSYSISTGAIVGICVGIAVLVVIIFGLWLLWFLAKKRGWDVRKSISRASRRLTGRFKDTRARRASRANGAVRMDSKSPPSSRSKERDLEKGRAGEKVRAVDTSPSAKKNRRTAMIQPPVPTATKQAPATANQQKSGFDAETPVAKSFREKYMRRQ